MELEAKGLTTTASTPAAVSSTTALVAVRTLTREMTRLMASIALRHIFGPWFLLV